MQAKFTSTIHRWASQRNILLLLAVFLLVNTVVVPVLAERLATEAGGIGPLDLEFGYSATEAYAALAAYGDDGRLYYFLYVISVDNVYAIIYALFFGLTISYCLQRAAAEGHAAYNAIWLPFGALVFDLAENAGLAVLLLTYPEQYPGLAQLTGLFTTIKWLLFAASLAAVVLALMAVVVRRLRPRPPDGTPPSDAT